MERKLLDRVRGLLAKAESTSYPEEAEAFTAKAAELASKYGINEAMLTAAGQSHDRIDQTRVTIGNPYSPEKATLLGSIAFTYHCRILTYGTPRTVEYCILFGYGVDRERTEIIYTSLLLQATSQVQQQWPRASHVNVTLYRRSWWVGFAMAVQERLEAIEQQARREVDEQSTGTPGTAIVLADRKTLVNQAFGAAYPNIGYVEPSALDMTGFLVGGMAGNAADLGQGGLATTARSRRTLS